MGKVIKTYGMGEQFALDRLEQLASQSGANHYFDDAYIADCVHKFVALGELIPDLSWYKGAGYYRGTTAVYMLGDREYSEGGRTYTLEDFM